MSTSARMLSLDALRGLTILGMIIVNTPGDWSAVYPPLRHADWTGCTPTDLVFPFFLFIMGFSLYLSTQKRIREGEKKSRLFLHLMQRSVIIFLIGLFLNAFPFNDLQNVRIPGVLQRIALVNLICGSLLIFSTRKIRVFLSAIILLSYWILFSFIPSPLTFIPSVAYENNWAAWLDQITLGKHTWQAMPLMDPEGILSTFPAIVTGLLGLETAFQLEQTHDKKEKVIRLFLMGFILAATGLAWSAIFPFIKKLWTSSYVLYTAGLASMTLGIFHWFIDNSKKNKPAWLLIAFGMNPLALYVGSELLIMILWLFPVFGMNHLTLNGYVFNSLCSAGFSPPLASLFWAVLYTSFWAFIAWLLHKRKIFLKL